MTNGFKARLYPNREQQQMLAQFFGCSRFVYNHFLEEKTRRYRESKESLTYTKMSKLLTEMKRSPDYVWLNLTDSMALQESLRNLDRGFQNFFQKRARYPKLHSRHGKQSYRTRNQNGGVRIVGNTVHLPKLGYVKFRGLKEFQGRILNATVSLSTSGRYYISLCVELEDAELLSNGGGTVGIDVGLKEFYTDSNGYIVNNPQVLKKREKKLARAQRRLSRKQKGSKNRTKQRVLVAREYEKIANIREDFLHKQSLALASENQVVCAEDLNVQGMLKNHKLSKAISDVSWSRFFTMLEYKTKERGGVFVQVPTFYPSSQTCSVCGYKNLLVKDLKVREWVCPKCGARHGRDENAAVNILNKGLEMLGAPA